MLGRRFALLSFGALAIFARAVVSQSPTLALTSSAVLDFDPGATAIAVGDLLGSSAPDLVLGGGTAIHLVENLGGGAFAAPLVLSAQAVVRRFLIDDLDGDGDGDLVAISDQASTSIFLQTAGVFARVDRAVGSLFPPRAADIDGDGRKDILIGNVAIHQTAPGVFAPVPATVFTLSTGPTTSFVWGDFDGNGFVDAARVRPGSPGTPYQADVYMGQGSTFAAPTTVGVDGSCLSYVATKVEVGDMNADGRDDLVLVSKTSSGALQVRTSLAVSGGGFAVGAGVLRVVPGGYNLEGLPVVADFDGDGRKDVLTRVAYSAGLLSGVHDATLIARNDGAGDVDAIAYWATYATAVPAPFGAGSYPGGAAGGDLDGDGKAEFVRQVSPYGISAAFDDVEVLAVSSVAAPADPSTYQIVPVGSATTLVPDYVAFASFAAQAVDAQGNVQSDVPIYYSVTAGAQYVALASCFTAPSGAPISVQSNGVVGTAQVTATLANGASTILTLEVVAPQIAIVSGNNQSASPGTPFAHPLVVEVTVNGLPAPNLALQFLALAGGPIVPIGVQPTQTVFTDAFGRASAQAVALSFSGQGLARAVLGGAFSLRRVDFQLTVTPPVTLSQVSSNGAGVDLGENTEPMIVEVRDYLGALLSNYPVTFEVTTGTASIVGSPVVFTDAQGRASAVASTVGSSSGLLQVTTSVPGPVTIIVFTHYVRGLTATGSAAGGSVQIIYAHEDGPTPLILAADVPQPGPIATIYGSVYTSILGPGSTAFALDPLGTFGNPDPALVANPLCLRTYSVAPAASGFSIVLQVYGFDPTYYPDLSQAIFVSNPVAMTL